MDAVAGSTWTGDNLINTVGTIGTGTWHGTAVGVLYGGTGATTVLGAQTNLGLVIGTNVEAWNANLDAVAGSTWTGDNLINTVGTIGTGTWHGTAVGVLYGGTGATSASGALSNLGAAANGANGDITSLTAMTNLNIGVTALTVTSSTFKVTATGINSTAIGQTTAAAGTFTNLVSTGDLTVGGHIVANGALPSATDDTPETDTVTGSDTTGTIALGSAGVEIITLTFVNPFANPPQCFISPANSDAGDDMNSDSYKVTSTIHTMVITFNTPLAASDDIFNYYVIGN